MSTRYPGGIIGGDPRNTDSTGIWTLNQVNQSRAAGRWTGYKIERSLRFNDDDSAYLSRTPATAGNRKTWTWSGWVKRGNLTGASQIIFQQRDDSDGSQQFLISLESDDTIRILDQSGGTNQGLLDTTAVFRDVSAWYHIVVSVDTTNATQADRVKLYVNSVRITSFTSPNYWPLDYETSVNNTVRALIGVQRPNVGSTLNSYLDGYMAEINFIDGEALGPEEFGFFDRNTGQWRAKQYGGSYGTNGFYLPFTNDLGDDESGNGNDWTPNNLAATDIVLDSPTTNFATLNPVEILGSASASLSDGNLNADLVAVSGGSSSVGTISTLGGEYYFEFTPSSVGNGLGLGITYGGTTTSDQRSKGIFYSLNGQKRVFGVDTSSAGASYTNGDVIGVAVDGLGGTVDFYKNGVFQFSVSESSIAEQPFRPWIYNNSSSAGSTTSANFGQSAFTYTPPEGYLALCTKNLPDPEITVPGNYFNTVLYTGNDGTQSITGVGFQPDFVWIKSRSAAESHYLGDSVRGAGLRLQSNLSNAEDGPKGITSFDADGFSLDGIASVNDGGDSFVAWNWKANGTGVTNSDGSITSTVSASPESGFSIVSYTGTGSPESFGHGLSQRPDFVIVKNRDGTAPWLTKHFEVMTDDKNYLDLNDTAPVQTASSTTFILSTSNNSVVSYGTSGRVSSDSNDYIAYCFHSVEGYSAFGSYTGNGSTDGPFVYTGFRPAFVIVKVTSTTDSWFINDSERSKYNVVDDQLFADRVDPEASNRGIDFLSNGFKVRNNSTSHNNSGETYIYMAFAEAPFKYSNPR